MNYSIDSEIKDEIFIILQKAVFVLISEVAVFLVTLSNFHKNEEYITGSFVIIYLYMQYHGEGKGKVEKGRVG